MASVQTAPAKARNVKATFDQVLFYFEGPQLILLSMGPKSKLIAVATDQISSRGFFGAQVSLRQFEDYLNERFDLRFLMSNPDREKWFEFELPSDRTEKIALTEVDFTPKKAEHVLPDHGLFARDHSEDYAGHADEAVRAVQRFEVAGAWAMREFSKFHHAVSDLYALSRSIELFMDDQIEVDRKRKIMTSFVKPWQGGGSYFGFYRSLAKAGGREYQPDIKAIQWASPGYIDVFGDEETFDRLLNLIEHFGTKRREIARRYEELWSFLREANYLERGSGRLDKKSLTATTINERAKLLSASLGLSSYRTLKKMASNDPVIAAKVLLATKRRVETLFDFFAQGRLAASGASVPDV